MTVAQRVILIVAALLMLGFSAGTWDDAVDPDPALATAQFMGAVGLLYLAARRRKVD